MLGFDFIIHCIDLIGVAHIAHHRDCAVTHFISCGMHFIGVDISQNDTRSIIS